MSLPHFLHQLFDHGRVTVELAATQPVDERELEALLREHDAVYREHLPPGLPPLNVPVASWAARTLYLAAQVLVYRDLESQVFEPAIQNSPRSTAAGDQFSADLCLRFLPDLVRLARTASANDPLVKSLLQLAADWPLSSVGISGAALSVLGTSRVSALAQVAAVWRLYVDRVLQTGDAARLADPATLTAARVAVGAFPQLAGKSASLLGLPAATAPNRSAPSPPAHA